MTTVACISYCIQYYFNKIQLLLKEADIRELKRKKEKTE